MPRAKTAAPTARRRAPKPTPTAQDVMRRLAPRYGPVQWHIRYSPAEELVYTILSQHTSDLNSERAFKSLMAAFGTLDAVADADADAIEAAIRRGGLAKQKAPRIRSVLRQIRDELGSFDLSFLAEMPLPEAKAWLKRLNGIGPKTAAIILCFSLGMPAMPVDTHIFRVSKRLGLIGPKTTADKAHDILEPMVAPGDVFAFHMYLIMHGRQICKAQRPLCPECPLAPECPARPELDRAANARKPQSPAKSRPKQP